MWETWMHLPTRVELDERGEPPEKRNSSVVPFKHDSERFACNMMYIQGLMCSHFLSQKKQFPSLRVIWLRFFGLVPCFNIMSERFIPQSISNSISNSNAEASIKQQQTINQIKLRYRWMDGWLLTGWEIWIRLFRSNWHGILGLACRSWGRSSPRNFEVVLSKQSPHGPGGGNCLWRRAAVHSLQVWT